jgi:hypothetical protein
MKRGLVALAILVSLTAHAGFASAQAPAAPPATPPAASPSPSAPPPPEHAAAAPVEAPAVKVTPYGSVYFNGFHNADAVNNEDVPLWAVGGAGDTSATARQSRFGLRISAPAAFGAKIGAVVEADFFGGFPAIGTGENFGQVRLRLANARLDWEKTSIVLGQDWMVFAPVNPTSLACAAIPLFAAAGNPWARIPQIRLERRIGSFLTQAAVLAPQSGDFNSTFLAQPNSGALSQTPYFQGRVALTAKNWFGSGKAGAIGISGHYGQSRVTPTGGKATDIDSAAGALDMSLPLGRHLSLLGEAFLGTNLAGFQSGVFQGLNPDAVSPGNPTGPSGIATKGGWAQIVLTPGTSKLGLSASYGVDDPDDEDLASATKRNWRLRNQVVALGLSYRCSAQLSVGLEYRFLKTKLLQTGTQDSQHLNLAAVLAF